MNRTMIIGNVGKDLVLRHTKSAGEPVTNIRLAVDNPATNDTDWFDVVVWGSLAENMTRYLKKGSRIAVEGRLQTRRYKDANDRLIETVEIRADSIDFLAGIRNPDLEQAEQPVPN